MTEIKPTYVTFEQAKRFKEKGFDVECKMCVQDGDDRPLPLDCGNTLHKNSIHPYYSAPEQWKVVEWLRLNHGIDIFIVPTNRCIPFDNYKFNIYKNKELRQLSLLDFKSPQEAYSAALDYVLNKLI